MSRPSKKSGARAPRPGPGHALALSPGPLLPDLVGHLPEHLLRQGLAIVGRTGSGKTYAAKGLAEPILASNLPACIVDPTGAWWGLRLTQDGQAASDMEIAVLGGDHRDIGIESGQGTIVGRLVGEGRLPRVIVDISHFSNHEAVRFLTDFFEELYRVNRSPLYLVLDEADMMAPQSPLPETRRLQGAVNKIVRRGRIRGFRPILITQRPQVIDKSVLSQIDTLIAMKLTAPQDRKAILDWFKGHAGVEDPQEIVAQLPSLSVGSGFIWSPEAGLLQKTAFPPITTFDSSRAPTDGASVPGISPLREMDIDFAAAALAPGAEAPPSGHTASASGRRPSPGGDAAARKGSYGESVAREEGYAAGRQDGYLEGREAGLAEGFRTAVERMIAELSILEPCADDAASPAQRQKANGEPEGPAASMPRQSRPARKAMDAPHDASERADAGAVRLNSAARKMLAVLDTDPPVRRSWRQVATLAGLRARGGHFNTGRKALLEQGLVLAEGDLIRIAKPGSNAPSPGHDPAALLSMWTRSLSGAAPKILSALVELGGTASRMEIAERLQLAPRGGYWNTGWKELCDNGLVEEGGDSVTLDPMFIAR